MATTYEKIATTTLGSAAASITFSSIAATYTDLRIVLNAQTTNAGVSGVEFQFNSDTATNYSYTRLRGNGTSATSSASTSTTGGYAGYTVQSSNWSMSALDIFSYAGSTLKTTLATNAADENGTGNVWNTVSLWRSTAAITAVKLICATGNFAIGTTATIYGILKA
jgi:hypothetical protein